jgi:hypothetical protein
MHNDVDAQFETLICTCSADVDTHVLHAVYTVGHMTGTRMLSSQNFSRFSVTSNV